MEDKGRRMMEVGERIIRFDDVILKKNGYINCCDCALLVSTRIEREVNLPMVTAWIRSQGSAGMAKQTFALGGTRSSGSKLVQLVET